MSSALETLGALVLEDGRRLGEALVDAQRACITAFLDPASTPFHFWTFARGWGKTTIQAAIAVAEMLATLPPGSRLYGLAADLDQSKLMLDSVESFRANTPELAGALDVQSSKVVATRTGSVLTMLASDAPSSFGLRPARVFIDEFAWWAETESARRLYEAVSTAIVKTNGKLLICTTASDPSHPAHKTLLHGRTDPAWSTVEQPGWPPWFDNDRVAAEERRLVPSMFARLFRNEWAASEDRLTSREDVLACVGHSGDLPPAPGHQYVVSLDVGLTNDRTAAVVAHRVRRDRRAIVVVDRLQTWRGARDRAVSLDAVGAWIATACRQYRAPLIFDPYQAAHLSQRLRGQGYRTEQFTFSQQNVGRLAVTLFRLLRDRLLDLPDDVALIDELVAVKLVERSPGVYRIDHASGAHDDMAIAVAMAAAKLVERPLQARSGTGGASAGLLLR